MFWKWYAIRVKLLFPSSQVINEGSNKSMLADKLKATVQSRKRMVWRFEWELVIMIIVFVEIKSYWAVKILVEKYSIFIRMYSKLIIKKSINMVILNHLWTWPLSTYFLLLSSIFRFKWISFCLWSHWNLFW